MSFGKQRPALRETSGLTVERAQTLTVKELSKVGRFGLRLLANDLGLERGTDEYTEFMTLSNDDQARLLFDRMQPTPLEKLGKEMREALSEELRWRRTCGDLAKLLRGIRL